MIDRNFIFLVRAMRQAQKDKNKDAAIHAERLVDAWLAKDAQEQQQLSLELDMRLVEHANEDERLFGDQS